MCGLYTTRRLKQIVTELSKKGGVKRHHTVGDTGIEPVCLCLPTAAAHLEPDPRLAVLRGAARSILNRSAYLSRGDRSRTCGLIHPKDAGTPPSPRPVTPTAGPEGVEPSSLGLEPRCSPRSTDPCFFLTHLAGNEKTRLGLNLGRVRWFFGEPGPRHFALSQLAQGLSIGIALFGLSGMTYRLRHGRFPLPRLPSGNRHGPEHRR